MTSPSPALREIADRLRKLSFTDMIELAGSLGQNLAPNGEGAIGIANALLKTSAQIELGAQNEKPKVTIR